MAMRTMGTLRLAVASDLHFEFSASEPVDAAELSEQADLLIAAGNIAFGSDGLPWCARSPVPCVYVLGNHEFFGRDITETRAEVQAASAGLPNVHVLDDTVAKFDIRGIPVRVIGGTLWTDYRLHGASRRQVQDSMMAASWLLDHGCIRDNSCWWVPGDALKAFRKTKAFIRAQLRTPFDGLSLVVTHHSPTPRAVPPGFENDPLNAASHSNLENLMRKADAWVFGHTHHSVDLVIGKCRVISNQRGYPGENPDFKLRVYEIVVP